MFGGVEGGVVRGGSTNLVYVIIQRSTRIELYLIKHGCLVLRSTMDCFLRMARGP